MGDLLEGILDATLLRALPDDAERRSVWLRRLWYLGLLGVAVAVAHVVYYAALIEPREGTVRDVIEGRFEEGDYVKLTGIPVDVEGLQLEFTKETVTKRKYTAMEDVSTEVFNYKPFLCTDDAFALNVATWVQRLGEAEKVKVENISDSASGEGLAAFTLLESLFTEGEALLNGTNLSCFVLLEHEGGGGSTTRSSMMSMNPAELDAAMASMRKGSALYDGLPGNYAPPFPAGLGEMAWPPIGKRGSANDEVERQLLAIASKPGDPDLSVELPEPVRPGPDDLADSGLEAGERPLAKLEKYGKLMELYNKEIERRNTFIEEQNRQEFREGLQSAQEVKIKLDSTLRGGVPVLGVLALPESEVSSKYAKDITPGTEPKYVLQVGGRAFPVGPTILLAAACLLLAVLSYARWLWWAA